MVSPGASDDSQRLAVAREALTGISQSLQADGYTLSLESLEGNTLTLRIAATEGACEECLVPKNVMEGIVLHALSDTVDLQNVNFAYPNDRH